MWWPLSSKASVYSWASGERGSSIVAGLRDHELRDRAFDFWCYGKPLPFVLNGPVDYELEGPGEPSDYVVALGGPLLVSEELWALIRRSSSCVVGYPSRLWRSGELVRPTFVSVNFERTFECLDLRRSRFAEVRVGGSLVGRTLQRMVVAGDMVPREERILRPREAPSDLLIQRDFVDEFEALRLAGVEFRPVAVA